MRRRLNSPSRGPEWSIPKPRSAAVRPRFTKPKPIWTGIVIDRSVTAGQTVAASFQAPTLFTIGDLHAVNIEIAVDEADIGELRAGQKVMFSVDAYSDKDFVGHVTQIRNRRIFRRAS
nr:MULTISPECIES: efflux RND transporter periplasmic adaptor subunit [unclassified Bradyrhizobium]